MTEKQYRKSIKPKSGSSRKRNDKPLARLALNKDKELARDKRAGQRRRKKENESAPGRGTNHSESPGQEHGGQGGAPETRARGRGAGWLCRRVRAAQDLVLGRRAGLQV